MSHRVRRALLSAVLAGAVVGSLSGTARADPTSQPSPSDSVLTPSPSPSDNAATPSPGESGSASPAPTGSRAPVGTAVPVAPTPTSSDVSPSLPSTTVLPAPATSPPNDGVAPSTGQVDEYLALTAQREQAVARLASLTVALASAQAALADLEKQQSVLDSATFRARLAVASTQRNTDDVARNLYQTGDSSLTGIATVLTSGPEGFIEGLDSARMVRNTTNGVVNDGVTAKADLAVATASQDALGLRITTARTATTLATQQVTAAQAALDVLETRLRALAIVPPQVTVGPDGCPTENVPATLRDGAQVLGAAALCRSAVTQAATPQAALAISWAFQHLGAAYACGGTGRMLPFRADCSSFVSRAYHEGAGLRTAGDGWAPSTRDMVPWDGVRLDPHYALVAPGALRPGDLVLYDTCPQGGCPYKHVVMYLGSPDGGQTRWMIHTNACGDVAKVETFWGFPTTGHPFLVARRVLALPGETILVPTPAAARAAARANRTLVANALRH